MEFSYPITCPKCEYQWETKAQGEMITCPSCMRKFSRPPPVIEMVGTDMALDTTCDICGRRLARLHICRVDNRSVIVCDDCLSPGTSSSESPPLP